MWISFLVFRKPVLKNWQFHNLWTSTRDRINPENGSVSYGPWRSEQATSSQVWNLRFHKASAFKETKQATFAAGFSTPHCTHSRFGSYQLIVVATKWIRNWPAAFAILAAQGIPEWKSSLIGTGLILKLEFNTLKGVDFETWLNDFYIWLN